MKPFFQILRVVIAFTLLTSIAYAGEPRMIDAINALRRAKTSADPWKDLSQAAQDLRFAAKNKVGYRAEALSIVDSAIATHPDKITLDRMIDDAIAKAEAGASVSHNRRRR
jgi:tetratricopeptide (TPR) repeat protein